MAHRMHFKASPTLLMAGWLLLGVGPPARAQVAALPELLLGATAVADDADTQPASSQIKAMAQQVQAVLGEARRQQDQVAQVRQRLTAAESVSAWLPWLVLALVVVGGLATWLGLRVRCLQRELQRALHHPPQRQAEDAARIALVPDARPAGALPRLSPERPLLSPADARALTGGQDLSMGALPSMADTLRSARDPASATGVPPRPFSVEELLDLDQQVEFFLVLGQTQAAIDLLLSHVRSTAGTSALPYFKLLEIYRQQDDEEAYERTRERFNQRFNAFAPDWSGNLSSGRPLEDYAEVMARLQRAWPQPMRAVAELESLLLRRADLEPFDLPAYREVLMLHALVLDLPMVSVTGMPAVATVAALTALPARAADAVDLLLPLDESPLEITSPRPHLAERASAQTMLADWVFTRSVTPSTPFSPLSSLSAQDVETPSHVDRTLDLDLTEHAPAPREFTQPAAFTDIEIRCGSRLSDLAFDAPDADAPAGPSRH